MTGTTTVRKNESERRDTSPSAQGVDHRRRDSDSSEEPWDQKKGSAAAMRTLDEPFEDLDDGELPSLQRKPNSSGKRMGGRIVNGQRTTTRPLSPPSQAGLVTPDKKEQRKFWGQLDADTPEERENSFDDGPDDEMQARQAAKRREERRRKEQRREEQRREEDSSAREDDYHSSFDASQTFETFESVDEQEVTLCGNTLQAINEMCGGNSWLSRPPESPAIEHKTVVQTQALADRSEGDDEEHTAIEVEFVEPTNDLSPQRKNAYLSAMAKKAKEDFEKNKDSTKKDPEAQGGIALSPSMDSTESADLYNSFNTAEKRKFLKLINGGINPAEASQRVVEEREENKEKDKAHSSRKGRASRLAFWKKSTAAHKDRASLAGAAASAIAASPKKQSEGAENLATEAVHSESEMPRVVELPVEQPAEHISKTVDSTAAPTKAADGMKQDRATPIHGDVDTTYPESDSEEDLGHFAKSGINYYDAVRREVPEEDVDLSISPVSSKEAGKDRRTRRIIAQKGFVHLDEEERSERASKPERSQSTPRPPLATKSKEIDSSPTAGILAVSEGSNPDESAKKSASRTVKSLLPPTPNRDAVIGAEDADALERIEKELLRPAAVVSPSPKKPRSSPKSSSRAVDIVPSKSSNMPSKESLRKEAPKMESLRKENDPAPALDVQVEQKKENAVQVEGMDVDIDTYMNAAEVYSLNGAMHHDGISVYTAGTGLTGASSYTQSSRVRRPGAAKMRLEKAKEAEDKRRQNGWVESMREAAASSNRVWKPELGWVDYEDPKNETFDTVDSSEKIHLNDRSFRSQKEKNREVELDASGKPAQVPFPPEWEQERDEMLKSAMDASVGPDASQIDVEEKKVEPQDGAIGSDEFAVATSSKTAELITSTVSSKPKGWVESMKVASAALAKDGHVWDPEHGWTNVIEKQDLEAGTSDVVDFDMASPTGAQERGIMVNAEAQTEAEYSSEDASPPASDDNARAIEVEEREPRAVAIPLPPKDGDRKLNQWIEKSEKEPKKQSERSTESSDKAVASAGTATEKYMQLGDNGSVRSSAVAGASSIPSGTQVERHDTSEDDEDDDNAPLLNRRGSFPTSHDRSFSPIVDIVREKVGEEDMDLFAPVPESREGRAVETEQSEQVSAKDMVSPRVVYSEQSVQGSAKSTSSSRRGAGPVDVDEVDETWESDDDQRHSSGWDAESYPMADESRSFDSRSASGSGGSFPSKKVPLLKRSKRDTTPIRTRTTQSSDLPVVSPEDAGPITAKPTSDEPEHQPGSPQRAWKPTSDEPEHQPDARSRRYNKPHEASQHASPSVKARLHQFESHEDGSEPPQQEGNGNASAEWKSFMGKKVRAESAAAESQHRGPVAVKEPEGEKIPYKLRSEEDLAYVPSVGEHKVEKEDDTLFEFGERGGGVNSRRGPGLESADLSPIRHRNDSDEREPLEYGSEAYGPEEGDKKSFFARLVECAAPVMPANKIPNDDSVPAAHLAFLRSNQTRSPGSSKQGASRYIPAGLCGRPDIIQEDDDGEESVHSEKLEEPDFVKRNTRSSRERPRASSAPRGSSSVVSGEDFNAKTAYLEAIAMKTAVSKPRKSESRRRGRSSANSSVSTSSSIHSEKWKAFLERKKASGVSPAKSRVSDSSVSRAAEKYASVQVEEMMSKMRSKSAPRSYRPDQSNNTSGESSMYTSGDSRSTNQPNHNRLDDEDSSMSRRKADSVSRAAEDLAAARVEAMMAALSNSQMVDEGEI